MIPEIKTFVTTVEKLNSIKNSFLQSKRDRNDEYDLALASLYAAICETKLYIAALNRGEPENSDKEALVAKLWHNAAVAMRRFDASLADRFYLKGSYWTEPASWTNVDVKNARITIDEMHEVCRQLILDKK